MEAAEFDQFADEYHAMHKANIAVTGEDPAYFSAYKIEILAAALRACGAASDQVLDFGSGIGNSLPYFREFLPASRLTCADVSGRSLALAQTRFPGAERPLLIEGDRIALDDSRMDVVFSACVFHHIPQAEHGLWLRELWRVTKPGGMIAIFEHNPLNPLTVRAVNTCPFDVNARLIRAAAFAAAFRDAGWSDVRITFHVFFPRALARLRALDRWLARVPLGAQYAIMAVKRV